MKHDIYHAVREEIVKCRTMAELRERLQNRGVEMQYKFRRGSMEVQGLSFAKDNCTFKGSQIDRNFSYKGMQIMFKAIEAEWKKIDEKQGCSFYRSNPDEPAQQQVQQQPQPQSQEQDHNQSGSFVRGGLGLLDLPPDDGGDDPDETAFRKRMQQQQKKKRGRRM
ncbi:MAG: hypothetical protein SNG59_05390 [Rikenellaceae bacterium]